MEGVGFEPTSRFSTIYSTVSQNFVAKLRNSLHRVRNAGLQRCLAPAKLCDTNLMRIIQLVLVYLALNV
jgi:hypothetical protein